MFSGDVSGQPSLAVSCKIVQTVHLPELDTAPVAVPAMSRAKSNLGPRSTAHCVVHGRSTSRITRGAATIGLVYGVYVVAAYSELLRQPADSALTSGAIGTIGVHATHRALDATGELKCGVLWFLHIPKTGGDTVKGSLKSWSRSYKRHKKFSASSRWTYVDLYQKTCEPGLNSTNMEDWAAAPSWQRVLTELAQPKPRIALQSHHCSPSVAALLPQLEQLNVTLQAKGCGLHLVTVLREPVSHTVSRMHYKNYNLNMSGHKETTHAEFQARLASRFNHQVTSFINIADTYLLCAFGDSLCSRGLLKDKTVPLESKTADVLAKFDLIGTTHSLAAFLARLATLVGHTITPSEGQLHEHGHIPHSFEFTEADKREMATLNAAAISTYTRFAGVDRLQLSDDGANAMSPKAVMRESWQLHGRVPLTTSAGVSSSSSASALARSALTPPESAGVTDPCAIPINVQADKSILWPSSSARPVWKDPGRTVCPIPKGLDAGTCVAYGPKTVHCLPSFVIIGVQKAATRELCNWLGVHSQLAATGKELHFLQTAACPSWRANLTNVPGNGQRDPHVAADLPKPVSGDPCSHMDKSSRVHNAAPAQLSPEHGGFWRTYSQFFPSQQEVTLEPGVALSPEERYYFEKTPEYIAMGEESIEKLRALFPNMRLIVQLRNPIDRMYSWFYMYCGSPGAMSKRFFEVLAPGPDQGRVFKFQKKFKDDSRYDSTAYRSVRCTPEAFERLVSVPTSADPVNRAVACDDGSCSWGTPDLKLSGPPSDPNVKKLRAGSASGARERGHYADLLRKWWKHFPSNHTLVTHTHLMFKSPIVQMQRVERFLGLEPDNWSSRFHNSSRGTATLANGAKASKIEKHARPAPVLARTRALLGEYFEPRNKDLNALLTDTFCGSPNDPKHQENCEGLLDAYPFGPG